MARTGSFFFVAEPRRGWPPLEGEGQLVNRAVLGDVSADHITGVATSTAGLVYLYTSVTVRGTFRLRFYFDKDASDPDAFADAEFETSPVRFTGHPVIMFLARFNLDASPPFIDVHINGDTVPVHVGACPETTEVVEREGRKPSLPNPVFAFNDPEAPAACAPRVAERARLCGTDWERPRPNKVPLNPEVPVRHLEQAVAALGDTIRMVGEGSTHHFGTLIGQLRALVYWEPGKANYTPLLLRLATRANLPLPVYARPPEDEATVPDVVLDAAWYYRGGRIGMLKTDRVQTVQDLMDVLELFIQSDRLAAPAAPGHVLKIKDALLAVAVSESVAHYDVGMEERTVILKELAAVGLDQVLMELAEVTYGLGLYVLHHLTGSPLPEYVPPPVNLSDLPPEVQEMVKAEQRASMEAALSGTAPRPIPPLVLPTPAPQTNDPAAPPVPPEPPPSA